jgi:ABC-2 type transport system ATP-binding protein
MNPIDPAFVANPTIEVTELSKWFGQKVAVSGVSCSFGPGITGLLGPNGAGKTTLLRMVTGLTRPSDGEVAVLGENPRKATDVFGKISLVPEDDAVYPHLTAREFVAYSAKLSGVAGVGPAVDSAIARVEMTYAADRKIGEYSKGMRQRAKVAAALVTDPEVLILDEPLNGTDPVQRAKLIALFHELADLGHTIIVSSHVLSEVERMSNRVIAVVDGRLAAAGPVAAIRSAMSYIPLRVRLESTEIRKLTARLLADGLVQAVDIDEKGADLQTTDLDALGRALPSSATAAGVAVTRFEPFDQSLESVFRYLVRGRP